jgi:predicted nucleic acid-binding protein
VNESEGKHSSAELTFAGRSPAPKGDVLVTQHLLDELAAVLMRPKFRCWISVADAIAFVETLGGHADLRDDLGPPTAGVRDPDDRIKWLAIPRER